MLKVLLDIQKLLKDQNAAQEENLHNTAAGILPQDGTLAPVAADGEKLDTAHSSRAAGKTIPSHTLHLAADVSRDMKYRRDELQRLEESTVYVCDQVKSNYHDTKPG